MLDPIDPTMTRTGLSYFVHQVFDLVLTDSTELLAGPGQLPDHLCQASTGSLTLF
jgi:hypothetical protein